MLTGQMDNEYVFVLGGTIDHADLIKNLRKRGYQVVLIDYFKNPAAAVYANMHIVASTQDMMAIEKCIADYNPRYIFSACVESSLQTLYKLNTQFNYKVLFTAEQYNVISNKQTMKEWLQAHQLSSAAFDIVSVDTPLDNLSIKLPLVVKPLQGNSSKGVSLIAENDAWYSSLKMAASFSETDTLLVEEFIVGTELSVDIAFIDGQVQVLMISEIIKKEAFSSTITQNIYNRELEEKWHQPILELATALGKKLNLDNTLMLIQCIVNETGISIVEFSLRIGGGNKHHLIKQIKNINLIDWYVQLMHNNAINYTVSPNPITPLYNFAVIEYIYPNNVGKIARLKIKEPVSKNMSVFVYKKEGAILNSTENSSNRIAGILGYSNHFNQLLEEIQHQKETISFTIQPI